MRLLTLPTSSGLFLTLFLSCLDLTSASQAFDLYNGTTSTTASSCSNVNPILTFGSSVDPSITRTISNENYSAQLLSRNITARSIVMDSSGNLLFTGAAGGIMIHPRVDCNGLTSNGLGEGSKLIPALRTGQTPDNKWGHGIAFSKEGKTLYASTAESVYSFDYDSITRKATGMRELIRGMNSSSHTTRTLLLPKMNPDLLLVARGSISGPGSPKDAESGSAVIRVFNLTALHALDQPVNFTTSEHGRVLGAGIKNSVGMAEHPVTGDIWALDNGADIDKRYGGGGGRKNPGDELNFLGNPRRAFKPDWVAPNYGSPYCSTVADPASIPLGPGQINEEFPIGSSFAVDPEGTGITDEKCQEPGRYESPAITFSAHKAPLELLFLSPTTLLIAFHGSTKDSMDEPLGYDISEITFNPTTGKPVTGDLGEMRVFGNRPGMEGVECGVGGMMGCWRPVGMVRGWGEGEVVVGEDGKGGEVWVLKREEVEKEEEVGGKKGKDKESAAGRRDMAWGVLSGMVVVAALWGL